MTHSSVQYELGFKTYFNGPTKNSKWPILVINVKVSLKTTSVAIKMNDTCMKTRSKLQIVMR